MFVLVAVSLEQEIRVRFGRDDKVWGSCFGWDDKSWRGAALTVLLSTQDTHNVAHCKPYFPSDAMGQHKCRHPVFYFGRLDEVDQIAVQGSPLNRVVSKFCVLPHFSVRRLGAGPNLAGVGDVVIKDPFLGCRLNIGDRGRVNISRRDSVFDGLP